MATVILGIAGAAGGALIAGPAGAWKGAEIGWAIGTTIGGIIDRPKYPAQSYGRLSDLRVTTSAYGSVIPRVWGKVRVPGNIIWSTQLKEHETDQSAGGGGSGGGGGQKTQVYTYTVSFALAVAKGGHLTSSSVKRIWGDDKIIYDSSTGALPSNIRWYYGTSSQTADPLITAQYGTDAPAFRNTAYLIFQDLLLTDFGSRIPNISVELDTGTITLDTIVTDVCGFVGLTSSDIDVTQAASTTIDGVVMNSRMNAKDALQPILSAYAFDMIDVDGLLRLVKRGGPPVAEIAWSDMGAVTGQTGTAPGASRITKKRVMEWELPKRIDVTYYSLLNDFQQASQGAVRQTVQSSQYTTVSLPISLNDDFARGVAERELYLAWTERNSFQTAVLPKFTYLSPADPVLVDIDNSGSLVRCRIDDMETGVFGEIRLTLVRDDEQAYIQSVGASPPLAGTATPSNVPTSFFAFSGVELRDDDFGQAGFYVAATGIDGWRGCAVYYSLDGGTNYVLAGRIGTRANFGLLTAALPLSTATAGTFDTTSTSNCSVALVSPGSLTSTSEASVSAGLGNFAVVTKADQSTSDVTDYELVGFAAASLVSGTTYALSDMKRALRGTANFLHPIGDKLVQVTTDLMRVVVPPAKIGNTVLVKCLSAYQTLSDVSAQTVYINTPTPSAISSVISTVTSAVAAIPKVPFWRCKIWYGSGISSGFTHIDHTYFDGANIPSGKTVFSFTKYALGPGGSFFHETPGLIAAIYAKIGIQNTTASSITVNWHIPGYDNGLTVIWNGTTTIIQEGDSDSGNHHNSLVTGSFTVAANSGGYLEVIGYNVQTGSSIYDANNQSQMIFMMDGFDTSGLQFYDANLVIAGGTMDEG